MKQVKYNLLKGLMELARRLMFVRSLRIIRPVFIRLYRRLEHPVFMAWANATDYFD